MKERIPKTELTPAKYAAKPSFVQLIDLYEHLEADQQAAVRTYFTEYERGEDTDKPKCETCRDKKLVCAECGVLRAEPDGEQCGLCGCLAEKACPDCQPKTAPKCPQCKGEGEICGVCHSEMNRVIPKSKMSHSPCGHGESSAVPCYYCQLAEPKCKMCGDTSQNKEATMVYYGPGPEDYEYVHEPCPECGPCETCGGSRRICYKCGARYASLDGCKEHGRKYKSKPCPACTSVPKPKYEWQTICSDCTKNGNCLHQKCIHGPGDNKCPYKDAAKPEAVEKIIPVMCPHCSKYFRNEFAELWGPHMNKQARRIEQLESERDKSLIECEGCMQEYEGQLGELKAKLANAEAEYADSMRLAARYKGQLESENHELKDNITAIEKERGEIYIELQQLKQDLSAEQRRADKATRITNGCIEENKRLREAYQETQRELFNLSCACSKIMERNFEQALKETDQ